MPKKLTVQRPGRPAFVEWRQPITAAQLARMMVIPANALLCAVVCVSLRTSRYALFACLPVPMQENVRGCTEIESDCVSTQRLEPTGPLLRDPSSQRLLPLVPPLQVAAAAQVRTSRS